MFFTSFQAGKVLFPDIHLFPEITPLLIIGEKVNNYRKRGDL